ncbi:MAG TPA: N-acyl homoserine lactonase family protein [Hypericibacter adhaerens]|uniref:Hydrolase glyoxylase n=1 Tax=Hypericibacter adhaerens TaxID=2602016 RepID=A0A5J6MYG6_9PROT|nr:N-acyl homoserine lactonase family protein [Hypericibacter adhaerens]QEX22758.1 hydrolase glyoxylase [Hypericibacter adhaerens]HWA42312.1 N-acyl homoserine lactonase family protein [Hypericibacter adhaerens]
MTPYSIWILEYAFIPECPLSSLVYGRHNQGTVKLPYGYVLIKGNGQTILVDCGYDHESVGRKFGEFYGVQNWRSPRDVLAEVGLTPEQIGHVIITHAHFDHMGGLALFPNAKFYIQEREISRWIWAMSLERRLRWLMTAGDPSDIIKAVELARDGRLVTLKGDVEDLFPGIDVRYAEDSHTPGSQYVVIRNDGLRASKDPYVCTGDLIYRHENLHGGTPEDPYFIPVGLAIGSQVNLIMTADSILKAANGDTKRVLAPHEENMPSLYPSRKSRHGLQLMEVSLAPGERSAVA